MRALLKLVEPEINQIVEETAKKEAEKTAIKTAIKTAKKCYELGFELEKIAQVVDYAIPTVAEWLGLSAG